MWYTVNRQRCVACFSLFVRLLLIKDDQVHAMLCDVDTVVQCVSVQVRVCRPRSSRPKSIRRAPQSQASRISRQSISPNFLKASW